MTAIARATHTATARATASTGLANGKVRPVAEESSSLRRGLSILFALDRDDASSDGGLTLTQIADLVGREKSQVSRALKVLNEYGLVDRDPDTLAFRLGWRIFAMAERAGDARLIEGAQVVLRQLVQELGERTDLSVLRHASVLTLMSESPAQRVQATAWVGSAWPAYNTSAGRALLLDHDRAALEVLFGQVEFDRPTARSPRNVADLEARIRKARADGYVTTDEELEADLVGVAAPVRDVRSRIVACVNVSAPKYRFGGQLAASGPRVKAAADELSELLGWKRDGSAVASK